MSANTNHLHRFYLLLVRVALPVTVPVLMAHRLVSVLMALYVINIVTLIVSAVSRFVDGSLTMSQFCAVCATFPSCTEHPTTHPRVAFVIARVQGPSHYIHKRVSDLSIMGLLVKSLELNIFKVCRSYSQAV